MKIEKYSAKGAGVDIPAIKITASADSPNAIIIHGYGGSKEEMLGLSWRISSLGFNTITIDLRGHGQNVHPMSFKIMEDVENIVSELKSSSGTVIAIGHSLGGRLALLSKADYRIGISPALNQDFSLATRSFINNMRK